MRKEDRRGHTLLDPEFLYIVMWEGVGRLPRDGRHLLTEPPDQNGKQFMQGGVRTGSSLCILFPVSDRGRWLVLTCLRGTSEEPESVHPQINTGPVFSELNGKPSLSLKDSHASPALRPQATLQLLSAQQASLPTPVHIPASPAPSLHCKPVPLLLSAPINLSLFPRHLFMSYF